MELYNYLKLNIYLLNETLNLGSKRLNITQDNSIP